MRAGTDWEGVAMGEAACDDRTRRRRRRRRVMLREIRTLEEMQEEVVDAHLVCSVCDKL
jgi:hypothetical protein